MVVCSYVPFFCLAFRLFGSWASCFFTTLIFYFGSSVAFIILFLESSLSYHDGSNLELASVAAHGIYLHHF